MKPRIMTLLLALALCTPLLFAAGESDAKAVELAKKSEAAMGGRAAYDAQRYVSWGFFDRRLHLWDKHENRYRMQTVEEDMLVLLDLDTKEGSVYRNGELVPAGEESDKFLKDAYEIWINDSYWLVMPWKLRDPGVHLAYTREDKTEDGREAHVLTMTFQEVGVTPENKYEVFIDKESHLVTQWSFFPTAADTEPRFVLPWANWKDYGNVKYADSRGKHSMAPVGVYDKVDDSLFESNNPAELKELMGL